MTGQGVLEMPELQRNAELLDKVAASIEERPDRWYQEAWGVFLNEEGEYKARVLDANKCETAFCIAGWAIALNDEWVVSASYDSGGDVLMLKSGDDPHQSFSYSDRGMDLLGLTEEEAVYLFQGGMSVSHDEVGRVAEGLRELGRGGSIYDAFPLDWWTPEEEL